MFVQHRPTCSPPDGAFGQCCIIWLARSRRGGTSMPATLRAKRVVVIGGTSGIGLAVARAASDDGATVIVGSSNGANVEAAVRRLPEGASGGVIDVTNESDVAAFFGRIGHFDHLVFTAGDWAAGPGVGGSPADWDIAGAGAVFAVRFWGALAVVKHGLGSISEDGSITLTDGVVAHRPRKGAPISTAMAGGIEHLARSLAVEDRADPRQRCLPWRLSSRKCGAAPRRSRFYR